MSLPTINTKEISKFVRVPVCSGVWRLVSTGTAHLRIGRKPREGASASNLPLFSVSLILRPLSWAGDMDTFPGSDEDYQRMLESGRVAFDLPVWDLDIQGLTGIYSQILALGGDRDALNNIQLESVDLSSKDGTRTLTVYDVRPWFALTEGAIIDRVAVEESNGFTNVARGVKTLVIS